MNTPARHTPTIRFQDLNWIVATPLARDKEQSHRLHEPDHLVNTIDPNSGRDIWNLGEHPPIVDGMLTIYFESEQTKAEFEHMPVNHPCKHSIGKPSVDMDRGG